MTPKEKAEELVNKYLLKTPVGFHIDDAKECALIAVNEILDAMSEWDYYWEKVKEEIEKL